MKENGQILDTYIKHDIVPKLTKLDSDLSETMSLVENEIGPQGGRLNASIQDVGIIKADLQRVGTVLADHNWRIEEALDTGSANTIGIELTWSMVARTLDQGRATSQPPQSAQLTALRPTQGNA